MTRNTYTCVQSCIITAKFNGCPRIHHERSPTLLQQHHFVNTAEIGRKMYNILLLRDYFHNIKHANRHSLRYFYLGVGNKQISSEHSKQNKQTP